MLKTEGSPHRLATALLAEYAKAPEQLRELDREVDEMSSTLSSSNGRIDTGADTFDVAALQASRDDYLRRVESVEERLKVIGALETRISDFYTGHRLGIPDDAIRSLAAWGESELSGRLRAIQAEIADLLARLDEARRALNAQRVAVVRKKDYLCSEHIRHLGQIINRGGVPQTTIMALREAAARMAYSKARPVAGAAPAPSAGEGEGGGGSGGGGDGSGSGSE